MTAPSKDPKELLTRAQGGDVRAAEELLPVVYEELHRLAHRRLRKELPGQTLQTTALVHEAYLRLVGKDDPGWEGRSHFFGAAAHAMRRILVEQARRRQRRPKGSLEDDEDPALAVFAAPDDRVLDMDAAVTRLEEHDPRKGRIVQLRYFCGMSNEETATALGLSLTSVEREWRFIRAYLRRELDQGLSGEPDG